MADVEDRVVQLEVRALDNDEDTRIDSRGLDALRASIDAIKAIAPTPAEADPNAQRWARRAPGPPRRGPV